MVCGKDRANPETIRLKNIPIESTIAAFWNVVLIPAPTPRRLGGRLFMMLARFGDANRPIPIPLSSNTKANSQ